jgi:hypothetical protein
MHMYLSIYLPAQAGRLLPILWPAHFPAGPHIFEVHSFPGGVAGIGQAPVAAAQPAKRQCEFGAINNVKKGYRSWLLCG